MTPGRGARPTRSGCASRSNFSHSHPMCTCNRPKPKHRAACRRRIELVGDSAERFHWVLTAASPADDPPLGRYLGSAGINLVMRRIQDAIVTRGFVTT